jgi:MFS family permease
VGIETVFLAGTGMSLTYLPAIVCVAYYFERKRSLAVGIALCGSSVGIAALGYLTNYLLAEYGWRGGMLILAGIELNCCAFGLLFVEPRTPVPGPCTDVLDLGNADTGVRRTLLPDPNHGQGGN